MNIKYRIQKLIKLSNELSDDDNLSNDEWQKKIDKELSKQDELKDDAKFKAREKSYLNNTPQKNEFDRNRNQLIKKILDFEGFHLLYYDKDPILGMGSFGVVFEGVFEGKPAAAKLIISGKYSLKDMGEPSEVENWKSILDLRQSMPVEFLVYIPEIYRLNSGIIEDRGEEIHYEIIIMEKLFDISKNQDLKAIYREPFSINSREDLFLKKINNLLKDEEFLYYIALSISSKVLSTYNLQIDISSLHKAMMMRPVRMSHYTYEFLTNIILSKVLKDYPEYNDSTYYDILYNDIFTIVKNSIVSFINRSPIPSSKHVNRTKVEYLTHMPEGYFFKFLDYLDSQGIKFRDLKESNLMVGLDGNIKLIDVGLYGKV